MDAFIKKYQYNYIKKCLHDLNTTYGTCADKNIIEANKSYICDKILYLFTNLSEDQKELLDISKITEASHIDKYLSDLSKYVYGMPPVTSAQLSKLFKKEKKLKLPNLDEEDSKNVYLGWVDTATNKLFVAYNLDDKLIGMACRITSQGSKNTRMCTLCNRIAGENEVAFVSPICKTANTSEGAYRSIGFNICLDSKTCNERIASVEKLEKILKNVNNVK